jgi:hypothetical protein
MNSIGVDSNPDGKPGGASDLGDGSYTYTDGGKTYRVLAFTDDGRSDLVLDVEKAGLADVLVVGGGGGGSNFASGPRGGGAGEVHYVEQMLLDATAYTVTVGAGGAGDGIAAVNGNLSSLGSNIKAGRGGGSLSANTADPNTIGGGGSMGGLRNDSTDNYHTAGAGAGHDTWGGANRYDGRPLSVVGSVVVYGLGGHTGTTGTANRGDGGYNGGNGGSGTVIVRVEV